MGRKVIKRLPDRLVYAGKIESWLKDMAKDGLILKRMGEYFAIFEKGEGQDLEYRVMAYDEDYFSREVYDASERAGWELIESDISAVLIGNTTRHNKYYVFKKPVGVEPDEMLTPLHTNGWLAKKMTKQKHAGRKHKKFSRNFLIAGLVTLLIFDGMYVSGVLFTIALAFFFMALLEKKDHKKIAEAEKAGSHVYQEWRNGIAGNRWTNVSKGILYIIIFVYALMLVVSPLAFAIKTDLNFVNGFIKLEEVQQAYQNEIEPTYGMYIPTFFAPTAYKALETGLAEDEDGNVKRVEYEIVYSKPIIPFVSRLPYLASVQRFIKGPSNQYGQDIETTSTDYFTNISFVESVWWRESNVHMVLCNNKEIMHIYYRGDKSAEEVIESLEQRLNK